MPFFSRLIGLFLSNSIALVAAAYFVKGFEITFDPIGFLTVAAIFTLINVVLKPVFKLVFAPIIIVTLGLGIVLVNAVLLYGLDFFSESVKIQGLVSLFYAAIIITIVNFITGFLIKRFKK